MAHAAKYGKGVVGLLKRGWNEIPEVMAGTGVALVGLVLVVIGVRKDRQLHGIKPYRVEYTIYREGDPKIAELKRKDQILN